MDDRDVRMYIIKVYLEVVHDLIIRWHKFRRNAYCGASSSAERWQPFVYFVLSRNFRFHSLSSLLPDIRRYNHVSKLRLESGIRD